MVFWWKAKKFKTCENNPFITNEKAADKKRLAQETERLKALVLKSMRLKMLSVLSAYIKDVLFAEDVMIMGFVKVFTYLDTFKFWGKFWRLDSQL